MHFLCVPDWNLIDTQGSRHATHPCLKQVRYSHVLRCLFNLVMGMSFACRHHPKLLPGEALQQNAPGQVAGSYTTTIMQFLHMSRHDPSRA